jgi:hypothetical protein
MKLNIHVDDPPTPDDDKSAVLVLAGVNACHIAFQSGRPPKNCPIGLERILKGTNFEQILKEIDGCNRISAGVTFRTMGPWAEIRFCKGPTLLKAITICFVTATQQFIIIAK